MEKDRKAPFSVLRKSRKLQLPTAAAICSYLITKLYLYYFMGLKVQLLKILKYLKDYIPNLAG